MNYANVKLYKVKAEDKATRTTYFAGPRLAPVTNSNKAALMGLEMAKSVAEKFSKVYLSVEILPLDHVFLQVEEIDNSEKVNQMLQIGRVSMALDTAEVRRNRPEYRA